jgi:hypothetical protein
MPQISKPTRHRRGLVRRLSGTQSTSALCPNFLTMSACVPQIPSSHHLIAGELSGTMAFEVEYSIDQKVPHDLVTY